MSLLYSYYIKYSIEFNEIKFNNINIIFNIIEINDLKADEKIILATGYEIKMQSDIIHYFPLIQRSYLSDLASRSEERRVGKEC